MPAVKFEVTTPQTAVASCERPWNGSRPARCIDAMVDQQSHGCNLLFLDFCTCRAAGLTPADSQLTVERSQLRGVAHQPPRPFIRLPTWHQATSETS
jgi:hypothetical protein